MKISRKVSELHAEDHLWLNKVLFYQDELQLLRVRLEKAAAHAKKNAQVLGEVEHFENQLRVQQRHIDQIKNRLQLDEARLTGTLSGGLNTVQERERVIHLQDKKEISDFEDNFNRLRVDFRNFLKKHL